MSVASHETSGTAGDHVTAYQALLRTSLRLRRRMRKLYEKHGLTGAQYRLLTRIPPLGITLTQLAKTAWADPGNTSGVVDRLEHEGWVYRTRSTADRRVVKVMLSDKGAQLLDAITPQYTRMITEIMSALSPQEIATLHQLLEKLDPETPVLPQDHELSKAKGEK